MKKKHLFNIIGGLGLILAMVMALVSCSPAAEDVEPVTLIFGGRQPY